MGTRISSSGSSAASQGVGVAQWQQKQQGMKDLMAALGAGDLGTAQKAYSSLSGAPAKPSGSSPLAQIGQALMAGDMAGAQKAAQTLQSARSGHHHHHAAQATPAATDKSPATPGEPSTGGSIHLTA